MSRDREELEALARAMCCARGHKQDMDRLVSVYVMEEAETPMGSVKFLDVRDPRPLWECWYMEACAVLDLRDEQRKADAGEK